MNLLNSNLKLDLDIIVIPYGARLSIEEDYLVWFAKSKNIKTVAIQENWDNLSSKKFIFIHPDYFITWGKQSTEHLVRYQEYNGKTLELGCIRMQQFYANSIKQEITTESSFKIKKNFQHRDKHILIIGNGSFHDIDLLVAVSNFIQKNLEQSKKMFFVFRPHPLARHDFSRRIKEFNSAQIKIEFPSATEKNSYRTKLIEESILVIGFYSTVLLESLILGKVVAIPSFLGWNYKYNPAKFLSESAHYSGIKDMKNVYNLETYNQFDKFLLNQPTYSEDFHANLKVNYCCENKDTTFEITNFLNNLLET
jgi:hypothetical protein